MTNEERKGADLHEQIAAAFPGWEVQVTAFTPAALPGEIGWHASITREAMAAGYVVHEGESKATRAEALQSLLDVLLEHPFGRAETAALLAIADGAK